MKKGMAKPLPQWEAVVISGVASTDDVKLRTSEASQAGQ